MAVEDRPDDDREDTPEVPPPLSPASADPAVEEREDLKTAHVEELREARRHMRETRVESQRLHSRDPSYTKADMNSDYLAAIQNFIVELEPFYNELGVCPEYWEPDKGEVLAVLERPAIRKEDVMSPCGVTPEKYPRLQNPEALESEVIAAIRSLESLLEFENARVGFELELRPRSHRVDPVRVSDTVVISRPVLDRARRWTLDFADKAGLTLGERDDGNHGQVGAGELYGEQ